VVVRRRAKNLILSLPYRTSSGGDVDIVALAKELERLRSTAVDVVASTREVRAVPERDRGILTIEVPDLGRLPLTPWGHEQLAEKTGIPIRYYNQMLSAGLVDLAAENVNAWLDRRERDKLLIRSADGKVRAVLSSRYRVLDNYDLAILTMERAKEHGAEILRCDLTDTHMYIKLVVPRYKEYLEFTPQEKAAHVWHEARDEVIPGLVVSNSEVGAGAFRVEPFLFRKACSNGVIAEEALYQVHLGREREIGRLVFSDETRRLEDQVIWSKARDIIDSTFSPDVLKALVDRLRASNGISIPEERSGQVVDAVVRNLQLSEEKRDSLLTYFAREGNTVFGLVQGVSRLAQDFPDPDRQVEVERYAGRVLYAPEIIVSAERA